jgi:hypothetical protein
MLSTSLCGTGSRNLESRGCRRKDGAERRLFLVSHGGVYKIQRAYLFQTVAVQGPTTINGVFVLDMPLSFGDSQRTTGLLSLVQK